MESTETSFMEVTIFSLEIHTFKFYSTEIDSKRHYEKCDYIYIRINL
jgi:hypothetical protein